MIDDGRSERITKNEVVFRDLNERVREIGERLEPESRLAEFVCECGNAECAERLELSSFDYERIRSRPNWFVVVPGHAIPDVERVVERTDGYEIVEKASSEVADVMRQAEAKASSSGP